MDGQSDVILTPNSSGQKWLEWALARYLWGYPKLVKACPSSALLQIREKNLKEQKKKERETNVLGLATDASEGRHPELPGTTRSQSRSPAPSRGDQVSTDENMHPDVHGVYTFEAASHPGDI